MTRSLSDQFILRMPPGLRDRIRQVAEANQRSMNAEILSTLLDTYPEPANPLEAAVDQLVSLLNLMREGKLDLAAQPERNVDAEPDSRRDAASKGEELRFVLDQLREEVERRRE